MSCVNHFPQQTESPIPPLLLVVNLGPEPHNVRFFLSSNKTAVGIFDGPPLVDEKRVI